MTTQKITDKLPFIMFVSLVTAITTTTLLTLYISQYFDIYRLFFDYEYFKSIMSGADKNQQIGPLGKITILTYGLFVSGILVSILVQLYRFTLKSKEYDVSVSENVDDIEYITDIEIKTYDDTYNISAIRSFSNTRLAFKRRIKDFQIDISRMSRASYINLTFGMLFSILALGFLIYVLSKNYIPSASWIELSEKFIPKLTVGLLIQLIGFFFLRLHVANENEIRYISNEITNFQSKYISYMIAMSQKDKNLLKEISKEMLRIERNFRIKNNERVIYEADQRFNDISAILDSIQKGQITKPAPSLRKKRLNDVLEDPDREPG